MTQQTTPRQMIVDGRRFYSIMDDLTADETDLQGDLWGVTNKDYAVELKGNDLRRFYISETLYCNL